MGLEWRKRQRRERGRGLAMVVVVADVEVEVWSEVGVKTRLDEMELELGSDGVEAGKI